MTDQLSRTAARIVHAAHVPLGHGADVLQLIAQPAGARRMIPVGTCNQLDLLVDILRADSELAHRAGLFGHCAGGLIGLLAHVVDGAGNLGRRGGLLRHPSRHTGDHPGQSVGRFGDLFSATGQRWGNPLYRWRAHAKEGYAWWIERIRHAFELADIVRIDHFRGFAAHWEIQASEPTAIHGRWVKGPGKALFKAIAKALGPLPILVEDLGVITPDVVQLRKALGLPGMRVLQFGWGEIDGAMGDPHHLPHAYEPDTVVYPGTHDNNTTLGWWRTAPEHVRHHLREYLASDGLDVGWDLIRAACASVADTAVYTLQDVLGLDEAHRMNFPGQAEGNWRWRFSWSQVHPHHASRLRRLCQLYERLPQVNASGAAV